MAKRPEFARDGEAAAAAAKKTFVGGELLPVLEEALGQMKPDERAAMPISRLYRALQPAVNRCHALKV